MGGRGQIFFGGCFGKLVLHSIFCNLSDYPKKKNEPKRGNDRSRAAVRLSSFLSSFSLQLLLSTPFFSASMFFAGPFTTKKMMMMVGRWGGRGREQQEPAESERGGGDDMKRLAEAQSRPKDRGR